MSEPLKEMAHFAGKACGTIVKDVAEFSQPLTEAFRIPCAAAGTVKACRVSSANSAIMLTAGELR